MVARGGAEDLIGQFVTMIEKLPASARRHWNAAERREFNIGVQGSFKPRCYELRLKDSTLAAAARVRAGVVVTIYATGKHFSGGPGEPPRNVSTRVRHRGWKFRERIEESGLSVAG